MEAQNVAFNDINYVILNQCFTYNDATKITFHLNYLIYCIFILFISPQPIHWLPFFQPFSCFFSARGIVTSYAPAPISTF